MATPRSEWRWFGIAAHFICSQDCRFHMATQVGPWLVSTVGQLWPGRPVREIYAEHRDAVWFAKNKHLLGDAFDHAYMRRFGYEEIGCNRLFETMVFRAGAPCSAEGCECGMPSLGDASGLDMASYNDAGSATRGHMAMCEKWAAVDAAELAKTEEAV